MGIINTSLIKGITVQLEQKTQTGINSFNEPVYSTELVAVDNVLIEPLSTDDIISDTNLSGKIEDVRLCIPKGDTHTWENTKVHFFGHAWQTYGYEQQWIEDNVPLSWNKKVKAKRIG